jgi:GTP cyclohydrolase I
MKKMRSSIDPKITRFPSPLKKLPRKLSEEEKVEYIATRFKEIMEILGLDLSDPSLSKSPYRVAKMYVNEVFSGLDPSTFPEISYIDNPSESQKRGSIVSTKVSFTSFCEHHFVPMWGTASVAYIPHDKLIGLSKIPRIVRFFAKRPQVQERLTAQIADSLALLLNTEDVAVSLTVEHFCVIARGIEDDHSHTITNVLRGQFESNPLRQHEFFESVNRV